MLLRSLLSPAKEAHLGLTGSTSGSYRAKGLLCGQLCCTWVLKSLGSPWISPRLWMLALECLLSLWGFAEVLAGKPPGSGVAHEHRKQKRGYQRLGCLLSEAQSTEQFRSTLDDHKLAFPKAYKSSLRCYRKQDGGQTEKCSSISC